MLSTRHRRAPVQHPTRLTLSLTPTVHLWSIAHRHRIRNEKHTHKSVLVHGQDMAYASPSHHTRHSNTTRKMKLCSYRADSVVRSIARHFHVSALYATIRHRGRLCPDVPALDARHHTARDSAARLIQALSLQPLCASTMARRGPPQERVLP